MEILLMHILVAFTVGGGFIALLSFFAESATKRNAGLILSLPSTVAIGLFFIGWTVSPKAVAGFAMGYPTAGAACYVAAVAYAYTALRFESARRTVSMILCLLLACVAWFILSLPMLLFPAMPLLLSLGIWMSYILVAHYFLAVRPIANTQPVELHFTHSEILFRSLLAGSLIASIVVLSKTPGPLWGGLMSAFPAGIISTLLIIHRSHPPKFLFHVLARMPAAAPVFLIYIFLAAWTFPRVGVIGGTVVTYGVSVGFLLLLSKSKRKNDH